MATSPIDKARLLFNLTENTTDEVKSRGYMSMFLGVVLNNHLSLNDIGLTEEEVDLVLEVIGLPDFRFYRQVWDAPDPRHP